VGGRIKYGFPVGRRFRKAHDARFAALLILPIFISACVIRSSAQEQHLVLPDDPEPQNPASSPTPRHIPCPTATSRGSDPWTDPESSANGSSGPCTRKHLNWYERFVDGPHDKPLTSRDKAWLATRNFLDPFNLITIGGDAAIAVAADSHSAYGPGFKGWGRNVGVSVTEDITGEFFGTFLIPSLVHQDPHYYRMEKAPLRRRIQHAITQVVWTQSDNGKGMLNYANLVGFAADDGIANLYVPDRKTDVSASFARYGTALATAPIGNFINEFLPDVARHIHVQIVIIQRIINQVANKETANSATQ
jgi:hypothetical protein